MKKKVIISISAVATILVCLVVAGAVAGPWNHHPDEKVDFIKSKIARKLDLNDTQRATLDRIAEQIKARHEQMADRRKEFKSLFLALLEQENVRPEELQTLFESKKPDLENAMKAASGFIAEFHSILTPEQRTQLVEEIESHNGRRCRFMRGSGDASWKDE